MPNNGDNVNSGELDHSANRELHLLCTRLYDDVISDEEMARLDRMLNESGAARKIYFNYVDLHQALLTSTGKQQRTEAELLRQHITDVSQGEETSPHKSSPAAPHTESSRERPWSRQRFLSWAMAAALLIAGTVAIFWPQQKSDDQFAEVKSNDRLSEPKLAAPIDDEPAPVAQVTYVSGIARWQDSNESFLLQTAIHNGDVLALTEGEIELTYSSGTKMLLVGPAELVVEKAGGILHKGGLVASVTEAGHGFTIETPNGKIVDLGTEFGVAVDDFGVSEVNVFQGKVEAFPMGKRGQGKKYELTEGCGLQWNEDDLILLDADMRRFATSVFGLSTGGGQADGDLSLVDRFRLATLDAEKWKSLGDVQTSTSGLQLIGGEDPSNRPYLISAEQFDPTKGPITVSCDFQFTEIGSADSTSLSILTRSADQRGIALDPWSGTLASCARCSFGFDVESSEGVLLSGVKMESDRELTSITGSSFLPPAPGTPYRVVMRDDGVNVSFTISLRDDPSISMTVKFRSLFHGKANFVALEGSRQGTTLIERVEISQDLSTTLLSSYADFSSLVQKGRKQHEIEKQLLVALAPDNAVPVLQDSFDAGQLDSGQWMYLGDVQVHDGTAHLGTPNAEGHIDTWKARPYLLTRKRLDPSAGTLTILGRISFADNFLSGYGASFSVMTRADDQHGKGPGWENSVLQRGVRANFWPASWDSEHSLEIHEKPTPNTITLLATHGLQVDPSVRTYLFRVIDDSESVTLTIVDPLQPEVLMTISSPATSALNEGFIGFESCWGSPVTLDDVRIYQDDSPESKTSIPANDE